jgi:hypothetical protein
MLQADGGASFFTGFVSGVGEVWASVQIAMAAGLPCTALRDAMLTHPTFVEGADLIVLLCTFGVKPNQSA